MDEYWSIEQLIAEELEVTFKFLEHTKYLGFLVNNSTIETITYQKKDAFDNSKIITRQSLQKEKEKEKEKEKDNEKENEEEKEKGKKNENSISDYSSDSNDSYLSQYIGSNSNDEDSDDSEDTDDSDDDSSDYSDYDEDSSDSTDDDEGSENEDDYSKFCCGKLLPNDTYILCDNHNCDIKWYHFSCVGITTAPKDEWFCPNCTILRKRHKNSQVDGINDRKRMIKEIASIEPSHQVVHPIWIILPLRYLNKITLKIPYPFTNNFRQKARSKKPMETQIGNFVEHWHYLGTTISRSTNDLRLADELSLIFEKRLPFLHNYYVNNSWEDANGNKNNVEKNNHTKNNNRLHSICFPNQEIEKMLSHFYIYTISPLMNKFKIFFQIIKKSEKPFNFQDREILSFLEKIIFQFCYINHLIFNHWYYTKNI
ncbi:inhibitor of growth protein [Anaeramoeba flamelloides]|uniref:Inhibitor of growth protein n=1 Tax=Anaeramoeba flamelloides TaxID=1746091 RepID=A0AAV8A820_9EUKA|nr:inhibitor of growth protein [Anaeramoeba flamelloides]